MCTLKIWPVSVCCLSIRDCRAFKQLFAESTQADSPPPTAKKGSKASVALDEVLNEILMITTIFLNPASFYDCFDYSFLVTSSSSSSNRSAEASCGTYHSKHWHKEPSKTEVYQSRDVTVV